MLNQGQFVKGQLWVHFEGRTFLVEEEQKKFGKKATTKATANIIAPMPGKVTKLLKAVGDGVKPGDVVVVMEAMKMEYTLKALVEGQITAIDCQVGQQVTLGKVLVKVKE